MFDDHTMHTWSVNVSLPSKGIKITHNQQTSVIVHLMTIQLFQLETATTTMNALKTQMTIQRPPALHEQNDY